MTLRDDLRRNFVDALARSFAEGVASLPNDGEITDAVRDLAVTSQDLVDALDEPETKYACCGGVILPGDERFGHICSGTVARRVPLHAFLTTAISTERTFDEHFQAS